jgi:predicted  nucleic acid-binding Zn-ribbon protein
MQERMERMEQAMEELRQQVAALSAKIDNLFG